jgi:hypothetical protein
MAFVRYTASADNTIVNTYQSNLRTRATGANTGQADILEVYSIYGRQTPYQSSSSGITLASQELSRFLIKFPITSISASRDSSTIPGSGNVDFYLKLYNAPHSRTVPMDYALTLAAISKPWQEGYGLDMTNYLDLVKGNSGSNWISASKDTPWSTVGGDYLTTPDYMYKQSFKSGLEDIEVNITPLVERWIAGDQGNYGIGVRLSQSFEAYFSASNDGVLMYPASGSVLINLSGALQSYYTKRFFARGTQYYFKRPVIEARWDDSLRDDRGNFYFSSSRAPANDNLNTIYLYNYIRGRLVNLPKVGTGEILVSLYSGSTDNSAPTGSKISLYDGNTNITGGWVSTGIYSCSIAVATGSVRTGITSASVDTLYDVWHTGSQYFTGTIKPKTIETGISNKPQSYVIAMRNLKEKYNNNDKTRLMLYSRHKNWQPNIYTSAKNTVEVEPIISASYRVVRMIDNYQAVPYGTGSKIHTGLSYDISGNYFDFDMKTLESGYAYEFKFSFYDDVQKSWIEQPRSFKFRVDD